MKIFINYRRKDAAGYAIALRLWLGQAFGKESIFLDVGSLKAGEDVDQKIEDFLSDCDVCICLIGETWLNITDDSGARRLDNPNDFVRKEIEIALKNKMTIIPILLNNAIMPKAEMLPDEIKSFSKIQALEISDRRFETDANQLIDLIGVYTDKKDNAHSIAKRINQILSGDSESRDIFKGAMGDPD